MAPLNSKKRPFIPPICGSNSDQGLAVAVDASGNAYATGDTESTNFPTFNPFQGSFGGVSDSFVTKINAGGSAFAYSSYLGGSSVDRGWAISTDASGTCYIGGNTYSTDFPSTPGAFRTVGSAPFDVFISKIREAAPILQITMNKETYFNGDMVGAAEFRFQNEDSAPVKAEVKCWLIFAGLQPISVINLGSDGTFALPPGLNLNMGPLYLFGVDPAMPRGNYELNSRMLVPATGKQLSEDINKFVIQE